MTSSAWAVVAGCLAGACVWCVLGAAGARPDAHRSSSRVPARRRSVLATVGRRMRAAAGRPADPAADRRAGLALVLALGMAIVHPLLGMAGALAPRALHVIRTRRARTRQDAQLVRALPDVIDLFRIANGGGLTVHESVHVVASMVDGPLGETFRDAQRRVRLGDRLADALTPPVAAGDPARPLLRALVSAERDGAPLTSPLERAAAHARDVRRRRAEEAARTVPVRLLFPLVLCVLPAFVLLTVVPLLAGTLQSLTS